MYTDNMAKLKIRTYPDPILKTVASEYKDITDEDRNVARDMVDTMFHSDGVGLAAPQIGVSKRLIVCAPQFKKGDVYIFFNPKFLSRNGEELGPEGCLSLPGISGEVARATEIDLEALDEKGKPHKRKINNFFARIIQHEIDHLDGKLYVDRVNFKQRETLMESYHETKML